MSVQFYINMIMINDSKEGVIMIDNISASKHSFIIQAQNEAETISKVITEVKKLNPYEVIVVVNGSTDQTSKIAKSMGCKLLEYQEPLGINLGKAIGAYYATGDILVFLDGDIVIPSNRLHSFVKSIQEGHDIALNDLNWAMRGRNKPDPTSLAKKALNIFLGREDLGINALGGIPNALSRKAVEIIGWWNLVDPPLSQTIGILQNQSISSPVSVDVIRPNKARKQHITKAANSPFAKSTSRIIGDHLQAIHRLVEHKGKRGGYVDVRQRSVIANLEVPDKRKSVKRSAVVSLDHGSNQLSSIINILMKMNVEEVIIVGSKAQLSSFHFKEKNIKIVPLQNSLGSYTSRLVGLLHSSAETTLFVDGHSVLTEEDLLPFYEAIERDKIDIALNNKGFLKDKTFPIDQKSTIQYFLNTAMKRPDLLNHSLMNTPYAVKRQVIEKVDVQAWMIPPLAYVNAVLQGFKIKAVHTVKGSSNVLDGADSMEVFLGDHIEAIHHYIKNTNERGNFTDGRKNRELIESMKKGEPK